MNKLHGLATLGLALAVGAGCARKSASSESAPQAGAAEVAGASTSKKDSATKDGAMKAGAPLALGRSLVVTIDLAITVENVDAARSRIRNEVERAGGYVADASTDGSGDGRKAHLTLRVPASSTSSVRTALDAVGIVDSDVEKVQDVTEERVDVEARLQNARVQEKRVIEIMSQKTGSIAEVLSAETELARIRETIERMDVQKRAMDSRVDLATLHVALETRNVAVMPAPPPKEVWETPGASISSSARGGLHAVYVGGVYALMVLAATAPLLLPLAALIFAVSIVLRNRNRKRLPKLPA